MPRPTPAQFAYGSATVIASTFAMLLLSQTRTGLGVGVIAAAALCLGLLVALTAAMPKRTVRRVPADPTPAPSEGDAVGRPARPKAGQAAHR
ncbi:hypothetical protein [Streptomyces sp. NPDC097619]|uniref:hypothetical protein n=1 Tax=Streptomyces sp. NPDC097619 TaxID=3157228 RepID=UPI0033266FA9